MIRVTPFVTRHAGVTRDTRKPGVLRGQDQSVTLSVTLPGEVSRWPVRSTCHGPMSHRNTGKLRVFGHGVTPDVTGFVTCHGPLSRGFSRRRARKVLYKSIHRGPPERGPPDSVLGTIEASSIKSRAHDQDRSSVLEVVSRQESHVLRRGTASLPPSSWPNQREGEQQDHASSAAAWLRVVRWKAECIITGLGTTQMKLWAGELQC